MPTIQEMLAADAAELKALPSDAAMTRVSNAAKALVSATNHVKSLESQLEEAKEARKQLAHQVLPNLFDTIGTDRIGVPGDDVDVKVENYYHASISAEAMSEAELNAAFDHLEELGGKELISTKVIAVFGRGDLAVANVIAKKIDTYVRTLVDEGLLAELPSIKVDRSIPWNTLTSFLRQWYEDNDAALTDPAPEAAANTDPAAAAADPQSLPPATGHNFPPPTVPDLQKLNATVGRVCKIVKRKATKKSRK